jgi:hypothetical protein
MANGQQKAVQAEGFDRVGSIEGAPAAGLQQGVQERTLLAPAIGGDQREPGLREE